MDWDYAPCSLDAELLEECGSDDGVAAGEGIWVEQSTADDTDEDDGETTAEDLRAVSDYRSSSHGAEVGNDLCYGHCVGAEIELVLEHNGIEILRAVGLFVVSEDHCGERRDIP